MLLVAALYVYGSHGYTSYLTDTLFSPPLFKLHGPLFLCHPAIPVQKTWAYPPAFDSKRSWSCTSMRRGRINQLQIKRYKTGGLVGMQSRNSTRIRQTNTVESYPLACASAETCLRFERRSGHEGCSPYPLYKGAPTSAICPSVASFDDTTLLCTPEGVPRFWFRPRLESTANVSCSSPD